MKDAKIRGSRKRLREKTSDTSGTDGVKISAVIYDFANPVLMGIDRNDENLFRSAMDIAVLAWNGSYLDELKRKEIFDSHLLGEDGKEPDDYNDFMRMLDYLVRRKQEHYSDHHVLVTKYDIIKQDNGHNLRVTSHPAPK